MRRKKESNSPLTFRARNVIIRNRKFYSKVCTHDYNINIGYFPNVQIKFIIWLAPWAGNSRWTKSHAVIGYPSGHDGAILSARDCPFCFRNKISPKSKRVHESFLSQNIFRDSKKIFCRDGTWKLGEGGTIEKSCVETREKYIHHKYIQLYAIGAQ